MPKLIAETDQKQNIHRRTQWLSRYIEKQRKQLSPENLKIFLDYNHDMIIHSLSENTRYKNLNLPATNFPLSEIIPANRIVESNSKIFLQNFSKYETFSAFIRLIFITNLLFFLNCSQNSKSHDDVSNYNYTKKGTRNRL